MLVHRVTGCQSSWGAIFEQTEVFAIFNHVTCLSKEAELQWNGCPPGQDGQFAGARTANSWSAKRHWYWTGIWSKWTHRGKENWCLLGARYCQSVHHSGAVPFALYSAQDCVAVEGLSLCSPPHYPLAVDLQAQMDYRGPDRWCYHWDHAHSARYVHTWETSNVHNGLIADYLHAKHNEHVMILRPCIILYICYL